MIGKTFSKVAAIALTSLFVLQACDSMGSLDSDDRKELAQLDRLGAFVTRYPNMPKGFVDLNPYITQVNKLAGYEFSSSYDRSGAQQVNWSKQNLQSSGRLSAVTCDDDSNKVALASYSGDTSPSEVKSTISTLKAQGVIDDDDVREYRGKSVSKRIRHPFYYGYEQEVKRGDIKQVTIGIAYRDGYGSDDGEGRISYSIEYACGEE